MAASNTNQGSLDSFVQPASNTAAAESSHAPSCARSRQHPSARTTLPPPAGVSSRQSSPSKRAHEESDPEQDSDNDEESSDDDDNGSDSNEMDLDFEPTTIA